MIGLPALTQVLRADLASILRASMRQAGWVVIEGFSNTRQRVIAPAWCWISYYAHSRAAVSKPLKFKHEGS